MKIHGHSDTNLFRGYCRPSLISCESIAPQTNGLSPSPALAVFIEDPRYHEVLYLNQGYCYQNSR